MSRVFHIADLHFGHRKIAEYTGERRFKDEQERTDTIIANWNSVVGKRDCVWVLGDVAFGRTALARVGELNGTKKLVLGNHDTLPIEEYLKYFSKVYGVVAWKSGVIMSHVPVHPFQLHTRFRINIHGHLHANDYADPRYLNVCCEQVDYTPRLWQHDKEFKP